MQQISSSSGLENLETTLSLSDQPRDFRFSKVRRWRSFLAPHLIRSHSPGRSFFCRRMSSSSKSSGKGSSTRASPRKNNRLTDEVPIFLQKAYAMVDTVGTQSVHRPVRFDPIRSTLRKDDRAASLPPPRARAAADITRGRQLVGGRHNFRGEGRDSIHRDGESGAVTLFFVVAITRTHLLSAPHFHSLTSSPTLPPPHPHPLSFRSFSGIKTSGRSSGSSTSTDFGK